MKKLLWVAINFRSSESWPNNPIRCHLGFSFFIWEDSRYQTAVRTEDIDKATAEVTGSFDGVEEVSAQQKEGIVNYIQRRDILAVLPTGYGKSLLFRLLPGICRTLNTMGYTKTIILVICPLNALIVNRTWRSCFISLNSSQFRFDWQIRDEVKFHLAQ